MAPVPAIYGRRRPATYVPWREYLAAGAGGTLGFIYNNLPGAIWGSRLGYKAGAWAAKRGTKRRAGTSRVPPAYSTFKRRRLSVTKPYTVLRPQRLRRGKGGSRYRGPRRRMSLRSARPVKSWTYYRRMKRYGLPPGFRLSTVRRSMDSILIHRLTSGVGRQFGEMPWMWTGETATNRQFILDRVHFEELFKQLDIAPAPRTIPTGGSEEEMLRSRDRIWIDSISVITKMKNQGNVPVTLVWYDLLARRRAPESGEVLDPINLWVRGLKDKNVVTAVGVPADATSIGAKPFESRTFCKAWLVTKSHRIVLQPGQEHYHKTFIFPNRMFTREDVTGFRYDKMTDAVQPRLEREAFHPYLTYSAICNGYGGLVQDRVAPLNISTSMVEVDCITKYKVNYRGILGEKPVATHYGQLSTAITDPGVVIRDGDVLGTAGTV